MDFNDGATEHLVQNSSDEDSDADEITDYLSLQPCDNNRNDSATSSQANYSVAINSERDLNHSSSSCSSSSSANIAVSNFTSNSDRKHKTYATVAPNNRMTHNQQSHSHHQLPHQASQLHQDQQQQQQQQYHYHINNNMVPIISVTPHSPGAKFNNILEDTLNHLQNIRESVVQMKNDRDIGIGGYRFRQLNKSNQKLQQQNRQMQHYYMASGLINPALNASRLFSSCPSLPDLTAAASNGMWPAQQAIGLNNDRRKSWTAIEDLTIECGKSSHKRSHHLSDSEDDIQDDRSLLCARDKIEVYADHPQKPTKRPSLFFRKKKDKSKGKGQSTNCDGCGAVINLATYKDHTAECKAKLTKNQQNSKGAGKKNSTNSHHNSQNDDQGRDYYDGHSHNNDHANYSDESPLIPNEFLHEPHVTAQDLGGEAILGLMLENEPDLWIRAVPSHVKSSLKEKQHVERQESIYEFIMTEKHHCQNLLLIQKVFVESLVRHFNGLRKESLFPRLADLTDLHTGFLKKLRLKQKESYIIDSIADLMIDFFSNQSDKLISAYGEYCSNHNSALEKIKAYQHDDHRFSEWYKHKESNPLLKRKGLNGFTLSVSQRLTKYPILIDAQIKKVGTDDIEREKLERAKKMIKNILEVVNACVAEQNKADRRFEIFKRIDAKSTIMFKNSKFSKADMMHDNRKLKFEGLATLVTVTPRVKAHETPVTVVVLSDCLFFLQEQSQKYIFFTPDNKAGVVSLQKLLIREKAGESRSIYIISTDINFPEMYELKVQQPKDKNEWIKTIRAAVQMCPSEEPELDDQLRAELKQKNLEAKYANIRELIEKMRLKDIEQALLLEEKVRLHANVLLESGAHNITEPSGIESFLTNFDSYKELITDDCDTVEISRRIFHTIQEISQLASNLYKAATGFELPTRLNAIGDRNAEQFQSPKLPTRAETFGGFDERRQKQLLLHHHFQIPPNGQVNGSPLMSTSNSSVLLNANNTNSNNPMHKELNYEALQVSHHLHTLLCIVNQQMTSIASLNTQLNSLRENPKSMYRHNDQLEELRNLQDKLLKDETELLRREEQLDKRQAELEALQTKINVQQKDIGQQRDELHKKMQILSNQGILSSSNVALSPTSIVCSSIDDAGHQTPHSNIGASCSNLTVDDHTDMGGSANSLNAEHRRKDKWRSASISKAPPVHLHSATIAPKVNQSSIKQQLPMKLSSNSSTKSEKSVSTNSLASSPISSFNGAGMVTQLLPLKLADKKQSQIITPNHSRTGSSPAIIQQFNIPTTGNPATRTNTYPKLPDRYRQGHESKSFQTEHDQTISPITGQVKYNRLSQYSMNSSPPSSSTSPAGQQQQQMSRNICDTPTSSNNRQNKQLDSGNSTKTAQDFRSSVQNAKEEEIYF